MKGVFEGIIYFLKDYSNYISFKVFVLNFMNSINVFDIILNFLKAHKSQISY